MYYIRITMGPQFELHFLRGVSEIYKNLRLEFLIICSLLGGAYCTTRGVIHRTLRCVVLLGSSLTVTTHSCAVSREHRLALHHDVPAIVDASPLALEEALR